ncbi:MAG: 2,3-diaminopropionate biosynthesis protein SbnA [Nitrospira sp.]|jgi:cysteine synthase A|nr:2,3-diaminopropionate biosynthesis protein SbnA [Nitrospira sp.]
MVHDSVVSCIGGTPLVRLSRLFPREGLSVLGKLELCNPGGSVKDRPARYIVESGLRDGTITSCTHLVESSSGNLGIALAMVARVYGLRFTCVVDPKIASANLAILRRLGATVDMVQDRDDQGGYLKTRIRRVHELINRMPSSMWVNQYANRKNWQAHFHGTAGEIITDVGEDLDALVVGVSTSGTIMGLSRRLREVFPKLRVIGVDAVGSVIFGAPAGPRQLPGIGASRAPELLSLEEIDEVIHVSDLESVHGCRDLALMEGIFAGGSSGAVVAAIRKLASSFSAGSTVLTLLPDRGDRYLDLVYSDEWVAGLPPGQNATSSAAIAGV